MSHEIGAMGKGEIVAISKYQKQWLKYKIKAKIGRAPIFGDYHKWRTYADFLRSEYWSVIKSNYYRKHPKICIDCGSGGNIQLHHKHYWQIFSLNPGYLVSLCPRCHQKRHNIVK